MPTAKNAPAKYRKEGCKAASQQTRLTIWNKKEKKRREKKGTSEK